jgi:hypothetical protein
MDARGDGRRPLNLAADLWGLAGYLQKERRQLIICDDLLT